MDVGCAWGRSVGRIGGPLLSVAITRDDALVVGCTYAETLVWDAQDGCVTERLPGASQVALVPNGGARETELVCAHLEVRLERLEGGSGRAFAGARAPIGVSPDGRWLAARGHQGAVVWNLESGEMRSFASGHDDPVSGLAFAPGPSLYVAYDYGPYTTPRASVDRFWLDGSGRRTTLATGPLAYDAFVAASPDGARIAIAARGEVELYDDRGASVAGLAEAAARAAAFSRDGTLIATAGRASLSLWDAQRGARLGTLPLADHTHTPLAFSERGLVCDDGDGYRFLDVRGFRFCGAAAGVGSLHRNAQALAEGLSLSAPHEADYRTSATPPSERQADGAWQVELYDGGITLLARARDATRGAIHLELGAFIKRPEAGWADAWADEHHTLATDVAWAHDLLDADRNARIEVRRGASRLGLEATLDCAPPADTLRRWLFALAARLRVASSTA